MDPRVVGLDSALRSFGIASVDGDGIFTKRVQPSAKLGRTHDRLEYLLTEVEEWAEGASLAVLEGLAFGAKGSSLTGLAGIHWMVRHALWSMGVPYAIVSPYTRAQYITGFAKADKDIVLAHVIRRFPEADVTGNDVADALVLAAMGREWMGYPIAKMPKASTELLTAVNASGKRKGQPKIDWPEEVPQKK